jgi:hypothetical protein
VVKDHSFDGNVWEINKVSQINSEAADITREMLADALIFSEGERQKTTTTIGFVEKNVYTTDVKILNQKPVGDQLDGFSE